MSSDYKIKVPFLVLIISYIEFRSTVIRKAYLKMISKPHAQERKNVSKYFID